RRCVSKEELSEDIGNLEYKNMSRCLQAANGLPGSLHAHWQVRRERVQTARGCKKATIDGPGSTQNAGWLKIGHPYTPGAAPKVNSVFSPDSHPIPSASNFRLLTEAERHASLQQAMADWKNDEDVWV